MSDNANELLHGHPLKAFMRYVGFGCNLDRIRAASPPERLETELSVYRRTLTRAVDTQENLTSLSLISPHRLRSFYCAKDPQASPDFLFYERGNSWAFIAQEAQRHIEVYLQKSPDEKCFLLYSSLASSIFKIFFSGQRHLLACVALWQGEAGQLQLFDRPPDSILKPIWEYPLSRVAFAHCAYAQWMQAAGYTEAPTLPQGLSLSDLLRGTRGRPFPLEFPAKLVLYRGRVKWKLSNQNHPQQHQFITLCTAGEQTNVVPTVCLVPWDRSMFRLTPNFERFLAEGVQRPKNSPVSAPTECKADAASRCCQACAHAHTWEANMSLNGPQTPYKTDLDLTSLLYITGWDSPDMQAAVNRCLDASVASFDIESCTTTLQDNRPTFGIDEKTPDREQMTALASQDPYMIGLCMGESERDTVVFEVASGETEHDAFIERVQAMVDAFQAFLIEQYQMVVQQKREWLLPLFSLLHEYRQCHAAIFDKHNRDRKDERCAWRNFLLGQLEREAELLCQTWTVYAFNGSGYDLPMLAPYLLRSRKLPGAWQMQRHGNAVNWMKLRHTHLMLRDIKKMLVPGASLESFAKSAGLSEARKPLFPYERLDRSGRFLDETSMPTEPEAYANRLTDQLPSVQSIQEACQDFRQRGFRTVRDYLHYYLINDCVMLQNAILRFHRSLKQLIGLHPVECRRYTLSSFSALASQHHLRKEKRIACWAPTHGLLYELLSRSMLGGLTAVTRTAVNAGGAPGMSPCNAHVLERLMHLLEPEEKHEAQRIVQQEKDIADTTKQRQGTPTTVHYLDCVSLYPSSGENAEKKNRVGRGRGEPPSPSGPGIFLGGQMHL